MGLASATPCHDGSTRDQGSGRCEEREDACSSEWQHATITVGSTRSDSCSSDLSSGLDLRSGLGRCGALQDESENVVFLGSSEAVVAGLSVVIAIPDDRVIAIGGSQRLWVHRIASMWDRPWCPGHM